MNGNNQAGESKNNNRDGAGQGVGGDNDEESMSMMHNAVGEHYGEDAFEKVRCACVFYILQIEQKFTSKQLYEKKYVWVNLAARRYVNLT